MAVTRASAVPFAFLALVACREPERPVPAVAEDVWPGARRKTVGSLPEGSLELIYDTSGGRAAMALVLGAGDAGPGAQILWTSAVAPAQRDALWSSAVVAAREVEGERRVAISTDGGATFRAVYPVPGGLHLCPHAAAKGVAGRPDWDALPSREAWVVGVLETAVWGCGDNGARCKRRSMVGAAVHHSEAAEGDPLALAHDREIGPALATAEELWRNCSTRLISRSLAAAVVDAAVSFQVGLDEAGLARLGALAAEVLGKDSPLAPEERRALTLRCTLARDEAKKLPEGQQSPRRSIQALFAALDARAPTSLPVRETGR